MSISGFKIRATIKVVLGMSVLCEKCIALTSQSAHRVNLVAFISPRH